MASRESIIRTDVNAEACSAVKESRAVKIIDRGVMPERCVISYEHSGGVACAMSCNIMLWQWSKDKMPDILVNHWSFLILPVHGQMLEAFLTLADY